MSKAVVYARFRGKTKEEALIAVAGQIIVCGEYARSLGFEVDNVYSDWEVIGEQTERVGNKMLIEDSASNEWDTIVVSGLDRLTRNMNELTELAKHKKIVALGMSQKQIAELLEKGGII